MAHWLTINFRSSQNLDFSDVYLLQRVDTLTRFLNILSNTVRNKLADNLQSTKKNINAFCMRLYWMESCHRQQAQMNREDALISGQWIRYKEPWYFKTSSVEMIEKSCCIAWQTVSTPPLRNNQLSFRKEAGCAVGLALWLIKCHTTVTFFKFTLIEDCCLLLIVSCRKFHHSSFGKCL